MVPASRGSCAPPTRAHCANNINSLSDAKNFPDNPFMNSDMLSVLNKYGKFYVSYIHFIVNFIDFTICSYKQGFIISNYISGVIKSINRVYYFSSTSKVRNMINNRFIFIYPLTVLIIAYHSESVFVP